MLYEFVLQFHFFDLFKLLIFVLPICLYLLSGAFDNKIARYITLIVSVLSTVLILIILFVAPLYSYIEIKQYIKDDSLLTVEGEVTDFESPENSLGGHNSESFKINGVDFIYYGNENYGYANFLCDGGVIKGNGQKLKISYCYDPITKEKVICYIQSME